jgi:hypothetical protein
MYLLRYVFVMIALERRVCKEKRKELCNHKHLFYTQQTISVTPKHT